MPEKLSEIKFKLTFKDVFDANVLYSTLYEYLVSKKLAKADENFGERFFRVNLSSDGKKSMQIWWRFSGNLGVRDFYSYSLDINLDFKNLVDVEVVVNNKKYTAQKGEFTIEVKAKLEMNSNDFWQHGVGRIIYERFWKRIYRDQIAAVKNDFEDAVNGIQDLVKGFFGIGKPPRFVPLKGIGF